jgi:hypothetical protein
MVVKENSEGKILDELLFAWRSFPENLKVVFFCG